MADTQALYHLQQALRTAPAVNTVTRELLAVTVVVRPSIWEARPHFKKSLADAMVQNALGQTAFDTVLKLVPEENKRLFDDHPCESQYLEAVNFSKLPVNGRQATVTFPSKYCWSALSYFKRGKVLHGILYQRSCDAWLGLPYDAYLFNGISRVIPAESYKLRMVIGSLYLYEQDWERELWKI